MKFLNGCRVYTKIYKVSNFEIMVKNWWAISPFLSDQVTIVACKLQFNYYYDKSAYNKREYSR